MSKVRLGILGSGQLAQMLIEAADGLGLGEIAVLDESGAADSPAALAGGRVTADLAEFFRAVDTVIFENEFVDCDRLEREAGSRVRFAPSLEVIRRLQNKGSQKRALHGLGIATAPFEFPPEGRGGDRAWLEGLATRFPRGAVLKWARLGYDGKGVCPFRPGDESSRARAFHFAAAAEKRGVELFAEELVDFRRELAIVACRTEDGRFAAYPLVESEQCDGICHWVRGPVADSALTSKAQDLARRFGEGVGLVGTFALELFETRAGELWVNEIAPRVHNAGHYTQDAAETSQFENHWRSALGRELGSTQAAPAFAMLNLLGPANLVCELPSNWRPPAGEGVSVHWYGKREARAGRKLGHVNARAEEPRAVPELVARLEAWHERWETALREAGRPR